MEKRTLFVISLICTVLVISSSLHGKPKPPRDETPTAPADSTGSTSYAGMFNLAGQAGLPSYLKCDQQMLGGADGLFGGYESPMVRLPFGEARTVESNFIDKDFVFDLVFEFKPVDGHRPAFVGIGENAREGGWVIHSVLAELANPTHGGTATVVYDHRSEKGHVGDYKTAGPHLIRVAKNGNAMTISITANFKGTYRPDYVTTIPNIKEAAPYLTRLNSNLFFGGNATFRAVRLEVDGKAVDPGPLPKTHPQTPEDVGWMKFSPGSSLPSYLDSTLGVSIGERGLNFDGKVLLTNASDFLAKDFTFDVVYRFAPDEKGRLTIGMGENGRDSGNWILNSVCSAVHGPASDGFSTVTFHNFVGEPQFARLGKEHAGPNLFRLQKRGDSLMMAICVDYADKFQPDFMVVIPSLKWQAPYLTDRNTHLFLGEHGDVEKMRLIVEGEMIESHDVAFDLPAKIIEGKLLHRRIAKAAGAMKFALADRAPKGLTLSPDGEIDWTPGHDQVGPNELKINITGKGPAAVQALNILVISSEDAKAVGDDLAKVETLYRLPLLSGNHKLAPGLGGASLLLLEGDSLRRLGPDGITVAQTWKLPHAYEWIGERAAYFVAMSNETKSLDFIDKASSKITRSLQMDYLRRFDLCLHPSQPIAYASVGKLTNTPGLIGSILIIDEQTGDVREPEELVGSFLQMSPDGSRLFIGANGIYKYIDVTMTSPRHHGVVANGKTDMLMVYDTSKPLQPARVSSKNDAGSDGQGLVISPDGRRISYLSTSGYPIASKDIAAWDTADLTKRPVAYLASATGADCQHVAFHRLLPIAAALTKEGAVCVQRETGEVEPNRLDLRSLPLGMKANDLAFSPDGRNLILVCESKENSSLCRVKLNLSGEELAKSK